MKITSICLTVALVALVSGCATTQSTSTSTATPNNAIRVQLPSRYVAVDKRTIEIGKAYESSGGKSFKNPHLDNCWLADGFNFTGYDTLYIAPVQSTAKYQKDEEMPHETAKKNLPTELANSIRSQGIFANVVTDLSDAKKSGRVLNLEMTIVEYAKGGGGARYWAGIYGAGQPVLRVQGQMVDRDKKLFAFDGKRSGVSAGARMFGAFKTDVDIQLEDIRSLTLDLTDFMAAIAGKYQAKN